MGNISIYRDWGWAPEFVEAIYKINNSKYKKDYTVGTGKVISLKYLIKKIFKMCEINMKFIKINSKSSIRPNEIKKVGCDPRMIYKDLRWKSKLNIDQIIQKLLKNEIY